LFETRDEVTEVTWKWMDNYNNHRPHGSLGKMTPTDMLPFPILKATTGVLGHLGSG